MVDASTVIGRRVVHIDQVHVGGWARPRTRNEGDNRVLMEYMNPR